MLAGFFRQPGHRRLAGAHAFRGGKQVVPEIGDHVMQDIETHGKARVTFVGQQGVTQVRPYQQILGRILENTR